MAVQEEQVTAGTAGDQTQQDRITNIWGARTPYQDEWPVRVDERTLDAPDKWVQSACVLCSTGCALDIGVKDGKIVGVRGRAEDRVNHGRLGPKGLHGWEANNSPDRLTQPLIRRDGKLQPASWEEAMRLLISRTRAILNKYTGGAIGIYNTGQLFLEEYYTLAAVAEGGLKTKHVDGNTRLCTATAAMALIQSFGTDGDPGSYHDLDLTDALFLIGHNPANTQTILWMRILDRLAGPNPPRLVVVDPRRTATAQAATVHLRPRLGTNLALMNGLLNQVIKTGQLDQAFIQAHTTGYETLEKLVAAYTPERVQQITGVSARDLQAAAEIIGQAPTLVSTVLQGVYQSWQATASAVQVNNLHLIRGLIGKPGATVFQMNGQPTAQNTRECGANGELTAFLNYKNPDHTRRLAEHFNLKPEETIHDLPPTHAMQIFRYAETGSIRMLWVVGTNPAVSMPELGRIRDILAKPDLFLVVNDAFLTETGQLADLVLPTALWGEKTGTFTNADRTVHISHKAVEPPGEARSDFDIFLEFSRRMAFQDKDGQPLIKWTEPEQAFDHFKALTKGRPCDYSGLTYAKLSGHTGIQWPCNAENPNGKERLYTDGVFNTAADYCETFGNDLETGAPLEPQAYKASDPKGRAIIKAAEFTPLPEVPDDDYPLFLTTGRLVYHFHTRTKTGRAPALQAAAPEVYVELCRQDAEQYGVAEGERVEISTRRGSLQAPVRICDIEPGHIFVPFHYGYWDAAASPNGHGVPGRAANELTLTGYDPVSKQPYFKFAAARLRKLAE